MFPGMISLSRVSHRDLARWYLQLSQRTAAGMGLPDALRDSSGPPAEDRIRMTNRLIAGESLDRVLEQVPNWLSVADRYLLSAAAQSGRMSEVCDRLATQHRSLSKQLHSALVACLYPLIVLHGALIFAPIPTALSFSETTGFHFDSTRYFFNMGAAVALFWIAVIVALTLARWLPVTRRRLQSIIPGLRRYAKARSLARFTWSLEAFLSAGQPIREAFGGAALVCDDPLLTPRLLDLLPEIDRGQPPGDLLEKIRGLPPGFADLYRSGERTGGLDRSLAILTRQAEEEAQHALHSAAFWYPKILIVIVALMVGLAVVRVYSQYFEYLTQLGG